MPATLPTLEASTARRDPAAALRQQAEKWTKLADYYRARGERTSAAKAERQAAGYRSALALSEAA